jgi:hypothetical protein
MPSTGLIEGSFSAPKSGAASRCASRGRIQNGNGPYGRHVNLEECFDRLNFNYFDSGLDKPRITWSAQGSRRTPGRYDATRHSISISRIFDSPRSRDL